jgi:hypothetical protein
MPCTETMLDNISRQVAKAGRILRAPLLFDLQIDCPIWIQNGTLELDRLS